MRWDDDDDDDDDEDECKDREGEKGEKSQDRIAIGGGASACLPKDANERETHVRRRPRPPSSMYLQETRERDEMRSQKT